MDTLYCAYAVFGLTVMALSIGAGAIKKFLWISEPVFATVVGVAIGELGFGLFEPQHWGDSERILEELARLSLAISLIGVAFRLPDTWVRSHWRSLLVLLLLGMPLMWLLASTCGWLVLGLPILQALLLGALITPTDPVVASSIVTGELAEQSIEADTRHLISAESGANDGLAFLLVMLPALLIEKSTGEALGHWLTVVMLGEVFTSIAGGALAGYIASRILVRMYDWEHTHHRSLLAVTLAMAFALLGIAKLLHGDGILAVFAAGLVMNWIIRDEAGHQEARHERMQETTIQFFETPVFIFFGMFMPFSGWLAMGWELWVYVLAILLVRRLPVVLLLYPLLKPLRGVRDALFVGWFGPVAVAAMVYATWAEVKEGYAELWTIGSFVIFVSIIVHGISATPLTRLYGRHDESR